MKFYVKLNTGITIHILFLKWNLSHCFERGYIENHIVDNTLAFTLEVNSTTTRTMLPKLKLPFLRPKKTGGCITLLYYSEGAELMLRTAEDDLTLLKESSEWTTVKVNIGQHPTAYQVSNTLFFDKC